GFARQVPGAGCQSPGRRHWILPLHFAKQHPRRGTPGRSSAGLLPSLLLLAADARQLRRPLVLGRLRRTIRRQRSWQQGTLAGVPGAVSRLESLTELAAAA